MLGFKDYGRIYGLSSFGFQQDKGFRIGVSWGPYTAEKLSTNLQPQSFHQRSSYMMLVLGWGLGAWCLRSRAFRAQRRFSRAKFFFILGLGSWVHSMFGGRVSCKSKENSNRNLKRLLTQAMKSVRSPSSGV